MIGFSDNHKRHTEELIEAITKRLDASSERMDALENVLLTVLKQFSTLESRLKRLASGSSNETLAVLTVMLGDLHPDRLEEILCRRVSLAKNSKTLQQLPVRFG